MLVPQTQTNAHTTGGLYTIYIEFWCENVKGVAIKDHFTEDAPPSQDRSEILGIVSIRLSRILIQIKERGARCVRISGA